jgi:hypothetical protein
MVILMELRLGRARYSNALSLSRGIDQERPSIQSAWYSAFEIKASVINGRKSERVLVLWIEWIHIAFKDAVVITARREMLKP